MNALLRLLAGLAFGLGAATTGAGESPTVAVQLGHRAAIQALAWNPGDLRLASASADGSVRVWNAANGREARVFTPGAAATAAVAWRPDGGLLVSAGRDRAIRVFGPADGAQPPPLLGHDNAVFALAWAPDGRALASAGFDRTIRLWRGIGDSAPTVLRTAAVVRALAWSPDAQWLAAADDAGSLTLRSATGETLAEFTAGAAALAVAWSADGRLVAGGFADGRIRIWPRDGSAAPRVIEAHPPGVTSLSFSADGRWLASGGRDGQVRLWRADRGELVRTLSGHRQSVAALAFHPRRNLLASAGQDNVVRLWDADDNLRPSQLAGRAGELRASAAGRDGRFALLGANGSVIIWNPAQARLERRMSVAPASPGAVAWSPDDRALVVGSSDGKLHRWTAGGAAQEWQAHRGAIHALGFSPDGRTLASAGADGEIRLHGEAAEPPARLLGRHGGTVRAVAFTPDGRQLVSGGHDDLLRVWDLAGRGDPVVLRGHDNRVTALAVSPDGTSIASASEDSTVRLWSPAGGEARAVLRGHGAALRAVVFSADGERLFSAGRDGAVRAWGSRRGEALGELARLPWQINSLAVSADGRWLQVAGDGGEARLLDAGSGRHLLGWYGFDDGEWVAVLPDGEFAGSPDGSRHLNVVLGGEVHGLDQFHEQFFRPEAVRAALALQVASPPAAPPAVGPPTPTQTPAPTTTAPPAPVAAVAAAAPAVAPTVAAAPPPAVAPPRPKRVQEVRPAPRVSFLELPPAIESDTVEVALRLEDLGGGIGDIRIYLNGSAVRLDDGRGGSRAPVREVRYPIRLAAGLNRLRAVAYNADNTMQSAEALGEVTATIAQARRPRLIGLVIGINEFVNPGLRLNYSVADAELFAAVLTERSAGLFGEIRLQLLTRPQQTTKAAIAAAIRAAQQQANPEDLFVFFVASHGTVDDGRYYLITANVGSTANARLKTDAFDQDELKALLANVPAAKKLIVLDTCNAGQLGESLQVAFLTRGLTEDTALKVLSRAVGSTVLSAATSYQQAMEGHQGHGLFTYVVAEGLRGNADADRDGFVKTTEIADWVDNEVPALAEKLYQHQQFPIVSPSGIGFPLTRTGAETKP